MALLLTAPDAAAAQCGGDCDQDGMVIVTELVRSINIALDQSEPNTCPAADFDGDQAVTVEDLVIAVNNALRGCPPQTPEATATSQPTPTPTPTIPHCGDGVTAEQEECDDGNREEGDGCTAACQLEPRGNVCAGVSSRAGTELKAVRVGAGFDRPVHLTAPPLDPHRLFIVEQAGRILIMERGKLLPTPFLAIQNKVSCCGERGLLSLAFHPEFEANGWFFVNYTDRSGATVIARYQVSIDPARAEPGSERILLLIPQPFANHNGGQLAFGPDGYLYVGIGDGGSGGDPLESGQSEDTLLGKLLRLDIDVDTAPYYALPPSNPSFRLGDPLGLIWAKGLRNPWRFSFDRTTGDLYIADVGQNRVEEVNVQSAGSPGADNYGWDIFEGTKCFEPEPLPVCPEPATGFVTPVLEYSHDEGCSVTGGFVYRGCALPDLGGTYFYGDFCTAFVRSFVLESGVATTQRDWTSELAPTDGTIDSISSFGQDARGELYIIDLGGDIFKIVPVP